MCVFGADVRFTIEMMYTRDDVHIVSTANEFASIVRADIEAGC